MSIEKCTGTNMKYVSNKTTEDKIQTGIYSLLVECPNGDYLKYKEYKTEPAKVVAVVEEVLLEVQFGQRSEAIGGKIEGNEFYFLYIEQKFSENVLYLTDETIEKNGY